MFYSVHRRGLVRLCNILLCLGLLCGLVAPGLPFTTRSAAALGTCTVIDLQPHTAPDGSMTNFTFTILDNDDDLAWVRVASPTSNLVIVNGSSNALPNSSVDPTQVLVWGDPIPAGNTIDVQVGGVISSFPPTNWIVEASTDSGGSNPGSCGGDLSVSTTSAPPPQISDITVTPDLISAQVDWTTDIDTTGVIDYGKTTSYGSQKGDNSLGTSHSVTLTSLTPGTLYHFQITATGQSNNSGSSSDGTFSTVPLPPGTPGTTTTITVVVTNPSDKTPPTIAFTGTLPKIATVEPKISGTANDDAAVAKVEYSTDGGLDWLPVDTATGLGSKKVTFSFTPVNLEDDTYTFMARAFDAGGNSAVTAGVKIVIDRLPPVVGGSVIALGPQVLIPNNSGIITTLPGISLHITTNATGGATNVAVRAMLVAGTLTRLSGTFTLKQAEDNGLWDGTMSFTQPGTYQLIAHAIDGAGTKTDRQIGTIVVAQPGAVLSTAGPLANALVTMYYRDPDSNSWVIWDGSPYGQPNPQTSDKQGNFSSFLPAGTYYVHAEASGYQSLNSQSFTLTTPQPITAILRLPSIPHIGPLSLDWFNFGVAPLVNRSTTNRTTSSTASLVGKALPTIALPDTAGQTENSISWLGKPTLLTLLSTWAPSSSEQLAVLDKLAANSDINVKIVGLQEHAGRLRAFNAIDGASLPWLADPDSTSVPILGPSSLPTHYVIDQKGVVTAIRYGVLDEAELLNLLTGGN